MPDAATAAAFLIPFALIVFLGMRRGGYEQPTFSEVGIAAWWLVAAGIAVAALPTARVGRSGWIALALLAAFAGWTALGISWSSSSGRSVVEAVRVVVYVGVFALALTIGGRERLRTILAAVAAACAVLALIALLSRLQPEWFPENRKSEALAGVQSRLAYPLEYWNGVAGLIAIGLPLLLWAVASARSLALRCLAAAAVPGVCLALFFTYSRGGVAAALIGLLALLALAPRRLSLIPSFLILAVGSGFAIWQASIRHQLADGLTTDAAGGQGDSMLIIVAAVGLLAALGVGVLGLLVRRGTLPRVPLVPRRAALVAAGVALVVGLAGFLAIGGPGEVSDGFERFKEPTGLSETSNRLESVAGNGRWQYWSAAADAGADDPLQGIGPGTFVFYWTQNRDINNGFVRDAHSLFLEVYAELGVIGLALIVAFVLFVLVAGARRIAGASERRRLALAAGVASAAAFIVAAGVDWLWELAVIPVAFLFVAAALLRPDAEEATAPDAELSERRARPGLPLAARIALPLVAVAAIVAIWIPWRGDLHLIQSQEDFRAGDLDGAVAEAQAAADAEPYSALPRIQLALAYERMDPPVLKKASLAAQAAVERESVNWETWYTLARILSQREGKEGAAKRALDQAQELDPLNPLINPEGPTG